MSAGRARTGRAAAAAAGGPGRKPRRAFPDPGRALRGETASLARARQVAASVPDPEIPMLTVADLGIIRAVEVAEGRVTVSVTPTYSGCPALAQIRADLAGRLTAAGFAAVEVRTALSPPWSSDWITAEGRRKLAAAGIAPPGPVPAQRAAGPVPLTLSSARPAVACPACGSSQTERTAAFSATACKDLHRCLACGEPFEHIKET